MSNFIDTVVSSLRSTPYEVEVGTPESVIGIPVNGDTTNRLLDQLERLVPSNVLTFLRKAEEVVRVVTCPDDCFGVVYMDLGEKEFFMDALRFVGLAHAGSPLYKTPTGEYRSIAGDLRDALGRYTAVTDSGKLIKSLVASDYLHPEYSRSGESLYFYYGEDLEIVCSIDLEHNLLRLDRSLYMVDL